MLSRVANSLYWMSRYIERAENIARIVDVNLQLLLDLRNLNEERLAQHWLPIMRNEGWWFAEVGKFIERADKTSRILDVRYETLPEKGAPAAISQTASLEWSAILQSCSAWDSYKSIHGADVHPKLVAEFLLLNGDFPRSVRFCVSKLNQSLRRISGVAEGRFSNDAEKLAGRLVAELQFTTVEEIFDHGLHLYLDQLQAKLNDIGGALFNTYILQQFNNLEDEIMVQQEEQQQQQGGSLINTPLQRGVSSDGFPSNPFRGFPHLRKTVETVFAPPSVHSTPLKQGVNENPNQTTGP